MIARIFRVLHRITGRYPQLYHHLNELVYRFAGLHMASIGLCSLFYRRFVSGSTSTYYNKGRSPKEEFRRVADLLDGQTRGTRPFILGPDQWHHSIKPLSLIEASFNFDNRAYIPLWLYKPNNVQALFRTGFGLGIEHLLGSRPFFYNLDVFRLYRGQDGKLRLGGLPHYHTPGYSICGFLVITGSDRGTDKDYEFAVVKLEHKKEVLQGINASDVLVVKNGVEEIEIGGNGDFVDLLQFHALPSLNRHISCQVAGFDSLGPKYPWQPKSGLPMIHIADKSKEYARIESRTVHGVNLGGGHFYRNDWINLDTRFGYETSENTVPLWFSKDSSLPFADGSLRFVYSAHCFEHIDDETIDSLLAEAYRCLDKGGIILILVPDFELALRDCREQSWNFVKHWRLVDNAVCSFSINNVDLSLENLTAYIFAGSSNITNSGKHPGSRWIYHGPPIVDREDLKRAIHSLDVKDFSKYVVSQLPKDAHQREHINAFTKAGLEQRISTAGFSPIDPFGPEAVVIRRILNEEASRKFGQPTTTEHSFNLWHEISMYVAGIKP